MNKLNLKSKENQKTNQFGILLTQKEEEFIKNRLELLKDICPSTSKLELIFKKKKTGIKGELKVSSYTDNFISNKKASSPTQTFLLLLEDIEEQLLDWKRKRFSQSLFNHFAPNIQTNKQFA